ncbi:MAG TPA: phage tail sheath C-terminal domain-containing protein, partial [Candidatus Acidoferrum sp.]|nr:phage tail sheath C-terminal domain-containing protein [Candidatus Acidoferrum sp.]
IQNPPANPLSTAQYHSALMMASTTYANITQHVLTDANVLPPSGGMAGVYANVDANEGVWQAPANVSMVGVVDLPIKLSADQQAYLNVDAIGGKAINAIRFFNGLGILVWGARTLDANSLDWRYVPVRRTMIMLEQSVKLAAQPYVFQPNDANTWAGVKSMVSSFLTSIWKEGGLQGATPDAAFQVNVGLGSTMTADDILNGIMRVTVLVAVVHPAEFIVITFEQEMPTS